MTKQIFTQSQQPEEEEILPKQEFYNVETTIDNEPLEGELLDEQFEQIVKPKSEWLENGFKIDRTFIFRGDGCTICSMDLGQLSEPTMDLPCFCVSEFCGSAVWFI